MSVIIRGFLIAGIVASLAACGVARRVQFQNDVKETTAQCHALMEDRALDPIRDKIPLADIRTATLAMRTTDTTPTPQEKAAIAVWDAKRQECEQKVRNIWGGLPIQEQAILQTMQNNGNALVADLYAGKITYATYTKVGSDMFASGFKALADVEAAVAARQEEQRERAAVIANQAIANMNAILQARRTTTCITTGSLTTCN